MSQMSELADVVSCALSVTALSSPRENPGGELQEG